MSRTYDVMLKHYKLTSIEIQTQYQLEKSQISNGGSNKEKLFQSDNIFDDYKSVKLQQPVSGGQLHESPHRNIINNKAIAI